MSSELRSAVERGIKELELVECRKKNGEAIQPYELRRILLAMLPPESKAEEWLYELEHISSAPPSDMDREMQEELYKALKEQAK